MARGRLAWDERYLQPTSARMVLVRMLSNLRASYARRHDALHLALVARLRAAIPELRAEAGDRRPRQRHLQLIR